MGFVKDLQEGIKYVTVPEKLERFLSQQQMCRSSRRHCPHPLSMQRQQLQQQEQISRRHSPHPLPMQRQQLQQQQQMSRRHSPHALPLQQQQ